MFALDLFNTKYEKELKEGAVDSLEARRIDDLNMRMLELLDRAKEPAYKKNPDALAGLKRQFQKIKAERDSYFKINPATGMDPTGSLGTTKGKLDEQHDSPVAGAITRRILMQRHDLLKQYGPELVGAAIDNVADYVGDVDEIGSSDVSGWVAQVERMLKENPPDAFAEGSVTKKPQPYNDPNWIKNLPKEKLNALAGPRYKKDKKDQGMAEEKNPYGDYPQSPKAFGAGNFQRIVRANMGNLPSVTLEFPNPKDNINLDKKGLDLISDYYDSLENDQMKNHFIYRILPSADEILTVLKRLGWNRAVQPDLPGIPAQGELPLQEKKKFDSNSDVTAGDTKVARELQKLRGQYPAAKSDVEAVAKAEIDSTERSQQQLSAIKGANTEQDRLLQQLIALDKKQGTEIGSLDNENDRLEQQLAQVEKTNARLAQTINQMGGQSQSDGNNNASGSRTINLIPNAPADAEPTPAQPQAQPAVAAPAEPEQKFKSKSNAMAQMAQNLSQPRRVQGISQGPAPSIRGMAANDNDQQIAVGQNESLEEDQRLHPGDPIIVTAPNEFEGKTGEIYDFSPSGSFVIVDLYNHGKHSMHLSDVAYNDHADQEDDWYDEGVAEGKKKRKKKSSKSMGGYFFPGYAYYGGGESGEGGGDGGGESINHRVAETALNSKDPQGDYAAKRQALHDLSLNKDVDQAAVLQRRLDLDREAKAKGVTKGSINEFAPAGGGGSGNYFQALASAWYNGAFDTGSLQKGIKSKEDVERLLNRGVVGPDGATRKYAIDYNSNFDGVVISSDDYYEHSDYNDQGQEVDSRTGQTWGPYDYMEFSDDDLSEGVAEAQTDYQKRRQRERDVDAGRPVKPLPKNPQTDYARKRAKDRKDMEMGEGNYQHGLADPNAPSLGAQEKNAFKRQELQHELGHERNNIAIAINGKTWKVVPGKGYADSAEERAYLNGMRRWAEKKSASSGKKWTVSLTGANPTVNELSTDKLAQYKTAAALDAGAADKAGDYKRGDKRFSGIVKATKKQFANDVKKHKPTQPTVNDSLEEIDRRGFLRGLGAAAIGAVGVGAASSAQARSSDASRKEDDEALALLAKGMTPEQVAKKLGVQGPNHGQTHQMGGRWASINRAAAQLRRQQQGTQGLNEFAPGGSGDDEAGDDPYGRPRPKHYNRSIDFFGQFEADHFDREDFDDATGVFKGYWGNDQIAYFKFDKPQRNGSNDPGMGWYYEPQTDSRDDNISAKSSIDNANERKQQELSMINAFLKSGNRPNPNSQIGRLMKKHGLAEGLMKEPTTRKEYLDQRDKLFRMMAVDSNPANKQIIKQALQDLEARYGNLKNTVKEESSTASEAVERAILNRIMVAHTDLLMKFGPDKVMQAAEEVAYNVGDVDEIGTSDVSAYVNQVKQILGA